MRQNVKLTLNVGNLEGGNSNNIKLNWLRLVKCKYNNNNKNKKKNEIKSNNKTTTIVK